MVTTKEFQSLEEKIGRFIEFWGFKAVEGKIWLHIFVSTQELCAEDLMKRLKISKALTSMSIKRLMAYGVILKGEKGAKGIQYYCANPNVERVIKDVIRQRERIMLSEIQGALDLVLATHRYHDQEKSLREKRLRFLRKITRRTQTILSLMVFKNPKFLSFGKAED